ncbi:MAG: DUF1573 domain-containing protein [Bacteroidales bacterium]
MSLFFVLILGLYSYSLEGMEAVSSFQGGGPEFKYDVENNRLNLGTTYLDELEEFNLEINFLNTGDEPLVVTRVWGCCGTNIKGWTREPVMPGDTGVIKVKFRLAPRTQSISRTVSAKSNDPAGTKVLRIVGKVAERAEDEF